jgi:alginate O-acetyltransferase complex protein AlgJ
MDTRKIQVALFLGALLAPVAANLAGFDGANARNENRAMADLPRLEPRWSSAAEFPGRFTTWFEDHFGFRSTLVRWSGEVRYFVLDVSPSAGVVRGSDDWLFYGDDSGMEDYVREKPLRADEVEDWRESIVRSHDWLRREGIAFVFTIAPDKHVLYPEVLPASIRPIGRAYRMDQLFEALHETRVIAVDLRPALREAKPREPLYEKTDTHWNERGAYVAYRQLIGAIRSQVPAVPPAWTRDDFEAVVEDVEAMDLAGMIGLKDILREKRWRLRPRRARQAHTVEPLGEEPSAGVGRIVTEIPGSTLPCAVVFRDSFASRLAPFLSEHFSRVVYLWQNNFDADVIRAERPDVVIQEIVGRHLMYVSPYSNAPAIAEGFGVVPGGSRSCVDCAAR